MKKLLIPVIVLLLTTCEKPSRNNIWDEFTTIKSNEWSPVDLNVVVNNQNSITLSWLHSNKYIEGFMIDRKTETEPWQSPFVILDKTQKTFTDDQVELPMMHSYRVYAFAGKNTSSYVQATIDPSLIVSPQNQTVNSASASVSFAIISNIDWVASCTQNWCTIANPSGSNNGTITINIDQNNSSDTRIATINISGAGLNQVFTLFQTIEIPNMSISPDSRIVLTAAGSTTFDIVSNTSWIAECNQSWCTITNDSGLGNGTISIDYAVNTTGFERVALISVLGNGLPLKTVTVTQKSILTNVALSSSGSIATAISSGVYGGLTHLPNYVADGDKSTYWSSQWHMPAWIKIQFNQVYNIKKVAVWLGDHKHTYAISLSMDGVSWTVVVPYTISGNEEGSEPTYEAYSISPLDAKYIKCDIISTSAPSSHIFQALLNELEAYK